MAEASLSASRARRSRKPKTILVTGASRGIGRAFLDIGRRAGHEVLGTSREPGQAATAGVPDLYKLDLAESSSIKALVARLEREGKTIDVLIANAGFQVPGAAEDLTRRALRLQFEANLYGTIELTNSLLVGMLQRRAGQLIFISSVFGFSALPYRAAYVSAKFALEGIVEAFRHELYGQNIRLTSVQLGPVESDFRKGSLPYARRYLDLEASRHRENYQNVMSRLHRKRGAPMLTLTPEQVAKKLVKLIERRRRPPLRLRPGLAPTGLWYARVCLPRGLYEWFIHKLSRGGHQ